jgi:hypothetical protein
MLSKYYFKYINVMFLFLFFLFNINLFFGLELYLVLCILVRLDVTRKHMTPLEVVSIIIIRDIAFLANTI